METAAVIGLPIHCLRSVTTYANRWQQCRGSHHQRSPQSVPSRFRHRQVNPCFSYRGLIVDVIRRLWDDGLFLDNKWLKMCHEAWFSCWVDYRSCLEMQEVDKQIEDLFIESEIDSPIFSEELEGETALGGSLELRSPWTNGKDNAN